MLIPFYFAEIVVQSIYLRNLFAYKMFEKILPNRISGYHTTNSHFPAGAEKPLLEKIVGIFWLIPESSETQNLILGSLRFVVENYVVTLRYKVSKEKKIQPTSKK